MSAHAAMESEEKYKSLQNRQKYRMQLKTTNQ